MIPREKAFTKVSGLLLKYDDFQDIGEKDALIDMIDSLDEIEIAVDIEKELNCRIPDEEQEAWQTVGDIVTTYQKHS